MDKSTPTAIQYLTSQFWSLQPEMMTQMSDILDRHFRGEKLSADIVADIVAERDAKGSNDRTFHVTGRGTAIIPVSGIIAKHSNMVNGSSQPKGTSVETLRDQFAVAMADRAVAQIMLHIESPGGSVSGLADFAQSIFDATSVKPVVAFIDDLGASAAYWIASGANKIYTNVTGTVGSIGVYCLYVDTTKRAEKLGLKYMIFRSGDNKGIGAPGIEITEGNAASIQENVNAMFETFLGAVLKGRAASGITEDQLRAVADGRCFIGCVAAEHNLVDGIMSFDQALAALESSPPALRTESTIVAAGVADQNNFNEQKESKMAKEKIEAAAIDAEKLAAAAATTERDRIVAIGEALPGDTFKSVRDKAIADGSTVDAAKSAAFDVAQTSHAAVIAAKDGEMATAQAKLDAIVEGGTDLEAAIAADADLETDTTVSGDDGKASTFAAAVKQLVDDGKEKGVTKGQAMHTAGQKFPDSYAAWITENQPEKNNSK